MGEPPRKQRIAAPASISIDGMRSKELHFITHIGIQPPQNPAH
jgi:hypothetical protein